jgi:hypothetical protein
LRSWSGGARRSDHFTPSIPLPKPTSPRASEPAFSAPRRRPIRCLPSAPYLLCPSMQPWAPTASLFVVRRRASRPFRRFCPASSSRGYATGGLNAREAASHLVSFSKVATTGRAALSFVRLPCVIGCEHEGVDGRFQHVDGQLSSTRNRQEKGGHRLCDELRKWAIRGIL